MTMKRNAESSLSERAIAFSVDAILSGAVKSKIPKIDHDDTLDSQEFECGNKSEPEYGLKSDCVFPFQEEEKKTAIQVELQSADLWNQFYRLGNEMIITKSGRRIFPALKVKVMGLEPKSHYIMWADILPVDNLRYRYVYHTRTKIVFCLFLEDGYTEKTDSDWLPLLPYIFGQFIYFCGILKQNHCYLETGSLLLGELFYVFGARIKSEESQWVVAGAGEEPAIRPSIYIHPDSPALGKQWQSQVVTFDKLKLTNNKNTISKGQVILHSMHKYLPRIHIQKTVLPDCDPEQQIDASQSVTFSFPETEFITVTAYQNQQITRLKIASNPFAKGFREVLRTGKKGPVISADRHKLEAVNNFSRNSADSAITDLSSTHGMPYTGNMNIDLNHQSAFFPASTSLCRLGTSPFHYSHDNLRTTYAHFPFSPCYDVRLLTPTVGAYDAYHHSGESLFHKVSNSGTVSVLDSYSFKDDSHVASPTNLIFGWRPGKEEPKPTARVAPCVLHDTHSHIYSQISSTAPYQKNT